MPYMGTKSGELFRNFAGGVGVGLDVRRSRELTEALRQEMELRARGMAIDEEQNARASEIHELNKRISDQALRLNETQEARAAEGHALDVAGVQRERKAEDTGAEAHLAASANQARSFLRQYPELEPDVRAAQQGMLDGIKAGWSPQARAQFAIRSAQNLQGRVQQIQRRRFADQIRSIGNTGGFQDATGATDPTFMQITNAAASGVESGELDPEATFRGIFDFAKERSENQAKMQSNMLASQQLEQQIAASGLQPGTPEYEQAVAIQTDVGKGLERITTARAAIDRLARESRGAAGPKASDYAGLMKEIAANPGDWGVVGADGMVDVMKVRRIAEQLLGGIGGPAQPEPPPPPEDPMIAKARAMRDAGVSREQALSGGTAPAPAPSQPSSSPSRGAMLGKKITKREPTMSDEEAKAKIAEYQDTHTWLGGKVPSKKLAKEKAEGEAKAKERADRLAGAEAYLAELKARLAAPDVDRFPGLRSRLEIQIDNQEKIVKSLK